MCPNIYWLGYLYRKLSKSLLLLLTNSEEAFCVIDLLSSKKDSLASRLSWWTTKQNKWECSGNRSLMELQPSSTPSSCCQTAGSHCLCRRLVFKVTRELETRGWNYNKTSQSSLFLLRFSHFSWINAPWIATSLLKISKALKNLILTILPVFSLLLWRNFQKSLICHSHWSPANQFLNLQLSRKFMLKKHFAPPKILLLKEKILLPF